MESELEIIKVFLDFLEAKKGYPKESLIQEMSVGGRMRADLVIVDPETNEPLAIFECERQFDHKHSNDVLIKLTNYKNALGYPDLPSFIISSGGELGFRIHQYFGESVAVLIPEYLPNFQSLENQSSANRKTKVKSETKETIDHFKISCYACAAIIGLILSVLNSSHKCITH